MKVIEFLGMSRAGKTTQLQAIEEVFKLEKRSYGIAKRPPIRFQDLGSVERFHDAMFYFLRDSYEDHSAKDRDYLLFDRGFYDRIVLLIRDLIDKRVSSAFASRLLPQLGEYTSKIDIPFVFLVSPELSLARWEKQKKDKLDHSAMSRGLDLKENLGGLRELYSFYSEIARKYGLILISGDESRCRVTSQLLSIIDEDRKQYKLHAHLLENA